MNDNSTPRYRVVYRGHTLDYTLFHEIVDFVVEQRPDLDQDWDFAEIEKIAQRLDRNALTLTRSTL